MLGRKLQCAASNSLRHPVESGEPVYLLGLADNKKIRQVYSSVLETYELIHTPSTAAQWPWDFTRLNIFSGYSQ